MLLLLGFAAGAVFALLVAHTIGRTRWKRLGLPDPEDPGWELRRPGSRITHMSGIVVEDDRASVQGQVLASDVRWYARAVVRAIVERERSTHAEARIEALEKLREATVQKLLRQLEDDRNG